MWTLDDEKTLDEIIQENERLEEENRRLKKEIKIESCDHPSWAVESTRAPYCGPGDTNYILCECRCCGHTWEIMD